MGMFLNNMAPYEGYKAIVRGPYFVDKSALLEDLLPFLNVGERYLCITRPRRFGKSVMATMIASYYGKAYDSSEVFDQLEIAHSEDYEKHLNQHNVIYIDFSTVPDNCEDYSSYIMRIMRGLKEDMKQNYSELNLDIEKSVRDILDEVYQKTGDKFIFVMDEWDSIFHKDFITDVDQKKYLDFLRNLLKGQGYVEMAYMTGVLPIAKYSSGSELNMFLEYDMGTAVRFSEYFGFSDEEVDHLYEKYEKINRRVMFTRDDLRIWYDGYHNVLGERLYNPRSIACALSDNQIRNYWTTSGPYDEIFYYIRNNVEAVRDDLVLMVAGEGVEADVKNYAAVSMNLGSRDEIYSAMVVYGLLTYDEGKVYIPNREIMEQFAKLLMTKDSLGYVNRLAKESEKMVRATLAKDTKTMVDILTLAHDTESPIFSYNSEIELSAVVNLVYLAARDKYRVVREDKAGEGYVDFIFYPERKNKPGIILELKVDSTPEEAIAQIKDKKYDLAFAGKMAEKEKYTGKLLAVGISYDKKTKEHTCKVEEL